MSKAKAAFDAEALARRMVETLLVVKCDGAKFVINTDDGRFVVTVEKLKKN